MPLESVNALPDNLVSLQHYVAQHEPSGPHLNGVELTEIQTDQAATELETNEVIQAEARAIAAAVAPQPSAFAEGVRERGGVAGVIPKPSRMSKSVLNELANEQQKAGERVGFVVFATLVKHGVAALVKVVKRFAEGRDHGLYTTVVEEILRELYLDSIGSAVWSTMKSDTANAFAGNPLVHGGTAFLEQVRRWWRPGRRITLVGHSTGAIYIGHFLEHADALLDPAAKFDVAFLAPACSFDFMAAKLPIFQRRVAQLRLFGLKDELERGYWEVPGLYPASLLYMVSGLFEEPVVDMPIVGMQRYYTQAEPYLAPAIQLITSYLEGKCAWSIAQTGRGWATSAQKHGEFNEDTTYSGKSPGFYPLKERELRCQQTKITGLSLGLMTMSTRPTAS